MKKKIQKRTKKKGRKVIPKEVTDYLKLIKAEMAKKKKLPWDIYIGHDLDVPKKHLEILNEKLKKKGFKVELLEELADDIVKPYAKWDYSLKVSKLS